MQHCKADLDRHPNDPPDCSRRHDIPPIVIFIASSIHPALLAAAFASSGNSPNKVRVTNSVWNFGF